MSSLSIKQKKIPKRAEKSTSKILIRKYWNATEKKQIEEIN